MSAATSANVNGKNVAATAVAATTTAVEVGDWKCAPPEIKRSTTGPAATTYQFKILQAPHDMVVYTKELSAQAVAAAIPPLSARDGEYHSYMTDFFQMFLTDFPKLFAKKHPPAAYVNILSHTFVSFPPPVDPAPAEYTVILNPVEFTIQNGKFIFTWAVELPTVDVQDELVITDVVEPEEPAAPPAIIELSDVEDADNADKELPIVIGSGIAAAGHRMSDRQFRDRQRVEEARLRAKLATVRAERALERYISRYGDYESEEMSSSEDGGETTDVGESMA